MRWSFPVGRLFGIPIRIHYTFILLLLFIWYVESTMLGPRAGFQAVSFWVLIFLCVLLHEFGHSLVAKSYGLTIASILLLPIGGVSQIVELPREPAREVAITIAGPIVNFLLAGLLLIVGEIIDPSLRFSTISLEGGNLIVNLFWANALLGLFNIVPAYPMDGGRILRGMIAMRKDYSEATRLAADVGKLLAIGFIVIGFFYNWWLILIGIFVFSGASSEAEAAALSSSLSEIPVRNLMITDYRTISPNEPFTAVVEKSLHTFQNDFPVVSDGRFVGILTRSSVIEALHHRMHESKVGDIARSSFPTIQPDEMAADALSRMRTSRVTVAPVEKDGTLLGIITIEKLLEASDIFPKGKSLKDGSQK